MIGPPTMFTAVMEDPADFTPTKVASLRVISSGMMGGDSPAFIEAARQGFGAIVKRSYGSTEAPTVSTCTNDDPPNGAATPTAGRSATWSSASPTPSPAARPATGQEGRGLDPRARAVRRVLRSGRDGGRPCTGAWFRSGDLGVVDDQGWLAITGRIKELIIRGGENISSSEVERALELHPGDQAGRRGGPTRRNGSANVSSPSSSPPAAPVAPTVPAFRRFRRRRLRRDRRGRVPALVRRTRSGPVQDTRARRAASTRCRCWRRASRTAPRSRHGRRPCSMAS